MTPQSAQVYKDIFGKEAPWTRGTSEERRRAWELFQAEADKIEVPEADFEQFMERIRLNRELKPAPDSNQEVDAA